MIGKTIHEINIGDQAIFTKTVTETDVVNYAGVTGDFNPAHMNTVFADDSMFKGRIAHGMLSTGLISAVLGMKLPGPGSIYLSQSVKFLKPVRFNDTITAKVEAIEKNEKKNRVTFKTICLNQNNEEVITGQAVLMPPTKK